jgi:peroxiredoxin
MSAVGPGAAAPRFRLPRLGGGTVDLDEFLAAGPVWLFFMKSTCGTCRLGAPFLQRFQERCGAAEAGADAAVAGAAHPQLLVVMEDSEADARAFADEFGWTLPVTIESAPWPVSEAYGLYAVPSNFVVATSGRVMRVGVGFYRTEWNDYARDLLANGPVAQGLDEALVAVPGAGPGGALGGGGAASGTAPLTATSQEDDLIAAAAGLPEFKPG